jgi:glycosyltransferase involved in cell wall biosynthesis
MSVPARQLRLVLVGDGESPHLLKWARALAPRAEVWVASTRAFTPGFDTVVPTSRRLALKLSPDFEGGNVKVLRSLPRLARWLKHVDADWIHAHYLTSHGTMACLAKLLWRLRGQVVGSAWGSDILVTPNRHWGLRRLTTWVLRNCTLCTSDSEHMAERMRTLGATDVMVFPFGLESMPEASDEKDDRLFFANRALEPIYAPERVIDLFAQLSVCWPEARLVVAHDGTLRVTVEAKARDLGLADRVRFIGRIAEADQARHYRKARWYLSLPRSDSVSVSVLEAMAHGCIPLLSDLPANRELVRDGENGLILQEGEAHVQRRLEALLPQAERIGQINRRWVERHALFPAAVDRFLARLESLRQPR